MATTHPANNDARRYVMTTDGDPDPIECTYEELAPQIGDEAALADLSVGDVLGVQDAGSPTVQIRRVS